MPLSIVVWRREGPGALSDDFAFELSNGLWAVRETFLPGLSKRRAKRRHLAAARDDALKSEAEESLHVLRLDAAAVAMGAAGAAGEADDAAVSRSAQVSVMEASSAMTAGDDRGIFNGQAASMDVDAGSSLVFSSASVSSAPPSLAVPRRQVSIDAAASLAEMARGAGDEHSIVARGLAVESATRAANGPPIPAPDPNMTDIVTERRPLPVEQSAYTAQAASPPSGSSSSLSSASSLGAKYPAHAGNGYGNCATSVADVVAVAAAAQHHATPLTLGVAAKAKSLKISSSPSGAGEAKGLVSIAEANTAMGHHHEQQHVAVERKHGPDSSRAGVSRGVEGGRGLRGRGKGGGGKQRPHGGEDAALAVAFVPAIYANGGFASPGPSSGLPNGGAVARDKYGITAATGAFGSRVHAIEGQEHYRTRSPTIGFSFEEGDIVKVVDSPPSEKKASAASYLVDRPSPDIVPWKFFGGREGQIRGQTFSAQESKMEMLVYFGDKFAKYVPIEPRFLVFVRRTPMAERQALYLESKMHASPCAPSLPPATSFSSSSSSLGASQGAANGVAAATTANTAVAPSLPEAMALNGSVALSVNVEEYSRKHKEEYEGSGTSNHSSSASVVLCDGEKMLECAPSDDEAGAGKTMKSEVMHADVNESRKDDLESHTALDNGSGGRGDGGHGKRQKKSWTPVSRWRTDHHFVGKRVVRSGKYVDGSDAGKMWTVRGRIVGWRIDLPDGEGRSTSVPQEDDGINPLHPKTCLWQCLHDDGDEEELDENDAAEAVQRATRDEKTLTIVKDRSSSTAKFKAGWTMRLKNRAPQWDGLMVVARVAPDSPADRAGLLPGDIFLRIHDTSTFSNSADCDRAAHAAPQSFSLNILREPPQDREPSPTPLPPASSSSFSSSDSYLSPASSRVAKAVSSPNFCNQEKKYRGVRQVSSRRWKASITIKNGGGKRSLGTFDKQIDAVHAYDTAARKQGTQTNFNGDEEHSGSDRDDYEPGNGQKRKKTLKENMEDAATVIEDARSGKSAVSASGRSRGVRWVEETHAWDATVVFGAHSFGKKTKKPIKVGSFATERAAARAYDKEAIKWHLKHDLELNFPGEWDGFHDQSEEDEAEEEPDEEESVNEVEDRDKRTGGGVRDSKHAFFSEVSHLAFKPSRFSARTTISEDEFCMSDELMSACSMVIKGRWCMDGASSLEEAASLLRQYAKRLEDMSEHDNWNLSMDGIRNDRGVCTTRPLWRETTAPIAAAVVAAPTQGKRKNPK